jgi:hypothetical protein
MPSPKPRLHKAMTLQKAKSMARRLGLTLRLLRSSKYRVTSAMGARAGLLRGRYRRRRQYRG